MSEQPRRIPDFDAIFDPGMRRISAEEWERIEASGVDPATFAATVVTDATEASVGGFVERLKADAPALLRARRERSVAYQAMLVDQWGPAFDLYEMVMTMAYEAGEAFNHKHASAAAENEDLVFWVLVRLHARACRIAEDVLLLLKGGFGQAAQARWRAIHEVRVVASFLAERGQELARRYLLHEQVEVLNAMHEYQRHADRLDQPPYSPQTIQAAEAAVAQLQAQYGTAFTSSYGWAHEELAVDRAHRRARAGFAAIEEATGLAHWRPYYRMASHATHANPRGITHAPDLSPGRSVLLAGPAPTGLADPGQGTLMALAVVTGVLLCHQAGSSTSLILRALDELTGEAATTFAEVQRSIETDDTAGVGGSVAE